MPFHPANTIALLAAVTALPLAAQSATLSAATAVTVTARSGPQTAIQTLPPGPMPALTLLSASIPTALGSSSILSTETHASPISLGSYLQYSYLVPTANGSADISASEFVLHLNTPAGQPMVLYLEHEYSATPGQPTPALTVDVFDDGSPEFDLRLPFQQNNLQLPGGMNVPTRIRLSASTVIPGQLTVGIRLIATPANTTVVSSAGQCTLLDYTVQPRFDGDLSFSAMTGSSTTLTAVVFGLAPMPQLLGNTAGGPCIGLPRPDIVLLLPPGGGGGTLAVPAAARPLRLYTQAITPLGPMIGTSESFIVNAF